MMKLEHHQAPSCFIQMERERELKDGHYSPRFVLTAELGTLVQKTFLPSSTKLGDISSICDTEATKLLINSAYTMSNPHELYIMRISLRRGYLYTIVRNPEQK